MLGAGSFFLAPEWGLRDQEDGVPSFGLLRFPRHLMETSRSFWPAFWAACVLTVLVLALGHFLKPTNPVSTAGKMEMVGPFQPGGKVRHVTPDNHVLTPAGIQVELLGFRPNALALSPDGKLLVAAGTAARLICVDPGTGQILEEVSLPAKDQVAPAAVSANILAPDGRAKLSFTGLIFSPDGTRLFLSNVNGSIKENRTCDQVLGDMPEGNGDPGLCIFGEKVTPNQHQLSRDFVLLDNTYCSGVLSADGHNWSCSAITTDYIERSFSGWPRSYPDGSELANADALAWAPTGFIWDHARRAGHDVRIFGEFCRSIVTWRDPAVEVLSQSRFWKDTCIVAIEDDPQNGWDHISAYRTTAYVVSAWTKRKQVIHTQYNQTSLIRTIGLILGLKPMHELDAIATPMSDCFSDTPDFTPWRARENQVPLDEMNPGPSAMVEGLLKEDAQVSANLPFDRLDACPEGILNGILWRSVKGIAAAFPVWAEGAEEDDDGGEE